jgi:hypothetical protein
MNIKIEYKIIHFQLCESGNIVKQRAVKLFLNVNVSPDVWRTLSDSWRIVRARSQTNNVFCLDFYYKDLFLLEIL